MDDNGQMENGRHKADHYKSVNTQWVFPQYPLKDNYTLKLLAERDHAIRDRNIALSEKKVALAERDMALLQRDAAVAERNTALMERDNAITALEYARENGMISRCGPNCPPTCTSSHTTRHQNIHPLPPQHSSSVPQNHLREMHVTDAYPISVAQESPANVRKVKHQHKESTATLLKKASKFTKRKNESRHGEDMKKQGIKSQNEWKDQEDLGFNQVTFDETSMPVPVCSCTGKYQPCYKWGNGGWQSACCTTTVSMYPLPLMPNKRHARLGGRKMSGNVFTRVLSKMAAEGHDLSMPVDLKDHWSKHGTNRYITIK